MKPLYCQHCGNLQESPSCCRNPKNPINKEMKQYVVGFLFDYDQQVVALIEKQKPEWQKWKWNGIGGKIEPGETPQAAMHREFPEETGLDIEQYGIQFDRFALICGPWGDLHCFCAILPRHEDLPDLLQMERERPAWIAVNLVRNRLIPIIPNLSWLIPLALDRTSGLAVVEDIPVNNV